MEKEIYVTRDSAGLFLWYGTEPVWSPIGISGDHYQWLGKEWGKGYIKLPDDQFSLEDVPMDEKVRLVCER